MALRKTIRVLKKQEEQEREGVCVEPYGGFSLILRSTIVFCSRPDFFYWLLKTTTDKNRQVVFIRHGVLALGVGNIFNFLESPTVILDISSHNDDNCRAVQMFARPPEIVVVVSAHYGRNAKRLPQKADRSCLAVVLRVDNATAVIFDRKTLIRNEHRCCQFLPSKHVCIELWKFVHLLVFRCGRRHSKSFRISDVGVHGKNREDERHQDHADDRGNTNEDGPRPIPRSVLNELLHKNPPACKQHTVRRGKILRLAGTINKENQECCYVNITQNSEFRCRAKHEEVPKSGKP